jgi:small subunit ribosomal protein S7e
LEAIFPEGGPPANWDIQNREYNAKNVSVYAITRAGRLLKVGFKMTLADLFLRSGTTIPTSKKGDKEVQDGLEVRDGSLSFVVVPKGKVEQAYIENFKREKEAKELGGRSGGKK